MTTLGITGFALISAAVVAVSQYQIPSINHKLSMGWLRAIGKYSYGIYVYHLLIFLPIGWYLRSSAGSWIQLDFPERILLLLAEMFVVLVVAKLSYDLIEVRFLRLKKYFGPG